MADILVNFDSGNGRCQAITWSNIYSYFKIGALGTKLSEIGPMIYEANTFIEENEFEYVVCKMRAILFRPKFVNSLWPDVAIYDNI